MNTHEIQRNITKCTRDSAYKAFKEQIYSKISINISDFDNINDVVSGTIRDVIFTSICNKTNSNLNNYKLNNYE